MYVFPGSPLQIPIDDGSDEPVSEASDAKSTPTMEGGSSLSCFEIKSSHIEVWLLGSSRKQIYFPLNNQDFLHLCFQFLNDLISVLLVAATRTAT